MITHVPHIATTTTGAIPFILPMGCTLSLTCLSRRLYSAVNGQTCRSGQRCGYTQIENTTGITAAQTVVSRCSQCLLQLILKYDFTKLIAIVHALLTNIYSLICISEINTRFKCIFL